MQFFGQVLSMEKQLAVCFLKIPTLNLESSCYNYITDCEKLFGSWTALNEALREEVQRLKIATGQLPNINGNRFNWGLQQNVPPYHQSGHQAQHHQSPSQGSPNGQSMGSSLNDPMDFM